MNRNARALLGTLLLGTSVGYAAPCEPEVQTMLQGVQTALAPLRTGVYNQRKLELTAAKENYNNVVQTPLEGLSDADRQLKLEAGITHFSKVDPLFEGEEFLKWTQAHPYSTPGAQLKTVGDVLHEDYVRYSQAQSAKASKLGSAISPKNWLECLRAHPSAQINFIIDVLFSQSAVFALNHDKFQPTVDAMANHLQGRVSATNAATVEQRYPFDLVANMLLWSVVFSEANCRNLLQGGNKIGQPLQTGSLTMAERFAQLMPKIARISKLALLGDVTYMGFGATEDALRGKPVDGAMLKDYLARGPFLFFYSTFWSPFKGTMIVEPVKLKLISSGVTGLEQMLMSQVKTNFQAQVAQAMSHASYLGLQVGWRALVSAEGTNTYLNLYQGIVVPAVQKQLTAAMEFAKHATQFPAVYEREGVKFTFSGPAVKGTDMTVEFTDQGLERLGTTLDKTLDAKLAQRPRR